MCDCYGPSVYDAINVKARTQHKCCECWQLIQKGEQYQKASGLWDGEWGNYKTCLNCVAVWAELNKRIDIDFCDRGHGNLSQTVADYDLLDISDNDIAKGSHCNITCTVPWLRRGKGGRYEVVQVVEEAMAA